MSIAATSTLAMVRAAEARGFQTADLLAEAGLARAFLEEPDARIAGPTVLGLWHALRDRTGDPALQLRAPCCLPFGAYRVIDYLVAASPTVGEGVRRFAGYFRLIADAVTLQVAEEGTDHYLCVAAADGGAVSPIYVDYIFAALVGRTRMRIRPNLSLEWLELRQREPAWSAAYEEVFRAPVRFAATADRLAFSDREWRAPTLGGDATLARLLEEHARILAQHMPCVGSSFTAQVQKTIASALPGRGSAEDVARALHMSVRTLQRKLEETGTTFREVSESVRGQLAEEYLARPKVSITEVAFLLGFSDQSSFNRAFRRWTGHTPGRWRRLAARR